MTSIDSIPPRGLNPKHGTASFSTHRNIDRPVSALRSGAATMPTAWETRGVQRQTNARPPDAPVRNFVDVALDPLRAATATPPRKIASLIVLLLGTLIWAV